MSDFAPTAAWQRLRQRADLVRRLRMFFDQRGFLEVETPLLSADTVVDRHLEPMAVLSPTAGSQAAAPPMWLQTSPEFGMKRMLAAGAEAIYQVTRAFRCDEQGPLHNPEFTIAEWYRVGDSYEAGRELLAELAGTLLQVDLVNRISYGEAFQRHAGVDPHRADLPTLHAAAARHQLTVPIGYETADRDHWLDLLLVGCVEHHLGHDAPTVMYDYPASQAMLARVRAGDPPVAERFELYVAGVELANGYHELRDPSELRLFQGGRELDEENAEDFGFEPRSIDVLLLTHAHLDHCGRIPLLVKRGFKGEIVATAATRELARVVMLDAAHLQEEDAARQARRARRRGRQRREALYGTLDALNALGQFGRAVDYLQPLDLAPGLTATFHDAGHILGSSSVRIVESGQHGHSVIFSGDLGNAGRPILRDPQLPPPADTVVMETTYGDRLHKAIGPSIEELFDAIETTMERGGNVIIPTFALERAQEILYYLREGMQQRRLRSGLSVFLDSPMAISATEIFRRHPECYDEETRALFDGGHDPFAMPGLRFTRETAQSMVLNTITGGAVIMAGSGMCTGGRVRHHLRHNLWRKDSSVVFVGYAAPGTLARTLIDGARHVHLFGDEIPVRARLHTINGFSAHADRDELLAWHGALRPARTILVHGEEKVMSAFATQLHDTRVEMPNKGDELDL